MLDTKALKLFVEMHQRKLNAKISRLHGAERSQLQLGGDLGHGNADSRMDAGGHWGLRESDTGSRRRPKSHYFDFIL